MPRLITLTLIAALCLTCFIGGIGVGVATGDSAKFYAGLAVGYEQARLDGQVERGILSEAGREAMRSSAP